MRHALLASILTSAALVACEPDAPSNPPPDDPGSGAFGLTGPPQPAKPATPRIREGDDAAKILRDLQPEAPTGEPADADGALAAAARQVRTEPGDLPRLKVEVDGEKLNLPLEHTHVSAEVSGHVARVEVTQTYENPFDYPIEAIYVFPLPENSAVDDMRMVIGPRVIESEIRERKDARRVYEEAKKAGRTAALLEQERPNVFTQSVANIAPGEDIDVVVRYVQDLTYDAGEYEFVFPMVVGPRFVPGESTGRSGTGWAPDTDRVPDGSRITPPIVGAGQRTGHNVSLELVLDPALPVVDFGAPTHRVDVVESDDALVVSLADTATLPNRDFVFRYRVDGEAPAAAILAHRTPDGRDSAGYLGLMIQPPRLNVDELVGSRELIFVLDVSGSMNGKPLALCKDAVREALGRTRPVDTFNIYTFAGRTSRAFERPRVANATNLEEALRFVDSARAGGGTYMAEAVNDALTPGAEAGRHRYVFFLTDGYVGNEREIFGRAEALVEALEGRGDKARVFGLGAGSSVNRHLIDGLSKAGSGEPIYMTNREDPVRAVDTFFRLVDHPVLTNLRVDWGDLAVEDVEPARLPDLFASRPVLVHARYTKPGRGTVVVRGDVGGRTVEIPMQITLPEREERHGALRSLWARTRIADLQRDLWQGPNESAREQMTRLGIDYRLVTATTSFVAVDRSRKVGSGDPMTVVQPVEAPEDVSPEAAGAIRFHGMAGGGAAHGVGRGGGGRGYGRIHLNGASQASLGAAAANEPAPAPVLQGTTSDDEDEASAEATGRLDEAAVEAVMKRWEPRMRAAWKAEQAKHPELSGALVLEWSLDAEGKVRSVRVVSDTVGHGPLRKALLRIAERIRFPKPDGGPTKVRHTLRVEGTS